MRWRARNAAPTHRAAQRWASLGSVAAPTPRRPPPTRPRSQGYAPLLQDWENFYTRRLYHRISDCWNRPIAGPPFAGKLPVIVRESADGNFSFKCVAVTAALAARGRRAVPRRPQPLFRPPARRTCRTTDRVVPCVNLGSYNYLGFADDWDVTCRKDVMAVARSFPVSGCTSHAEGGYTALHAALEECVADFLGKEAAVSWRC